MYWKYSLYMILFYHHKDSHRVSIYLILFIYIKARSKSLHNHHRDFNLQRTRKKEHHYKNLPRPQQNK